MVLLVQYGSTNQKEYAAMNRTQRRKPLQLKWIESQGDASYHDWDDDGVCKFCGFDGAEYHHWYTSIPVEQRGEKSRESKYCRYQ